MILKAIWCENLLGYIGKDNDLLYRIPEDMALFKNLTMGHIVIMGRKTWMSLGEKPLPGRTNVILSRTLKVSETESSDVLFYSSIDELMGTLGSPGNADKVAWVIGGEEIYDQLMPYVSNVHVTCVYDGGTGTAKAPAQQWKKDFHVVNFTGKKQYQKEPGKVINFAFTEYERINNGNQKTNETRREEKSGGQQTSLDQGTTGIEEEARQEGSDFW